MGRGIHKTHIEKKIQVNVKFRESRLFLLKEEGIISNFRTANQYVNMLVTEDLKRRGIKE